MRKADTLPGNLRVVLWAAVIVAAGALLAGLCGGALARALPAGGGAAPLPVYTSLSLAAEDEPLLPIWQRYDPEQTTPVADQELGTSLSQTYECLLWPLGIYGLDYEELPELTFEQLLTDDCSACYLRGYTMPGTLMLTNLYSGRMMEQTGAQLDLAFGADLNAGYQMSLRLSFPDVAAASATQLSQAVDLVQRDLCSFLAGHKDTLLGVTPEGWYSLSEGFYSELLERLVARAFLQRDLELTDEAWLQRLCDELLLDVQIIQLENEVLLTLTDRNGTGMLCLYYDARLCCVSGAALQLL